MDVVVSWGNDLGKKVQESIPEGAIVLKQEDEFETASMLILVHHDEFELVPEGELIPRVVLDLSAKDEQLIHTIH